VYYAYNRCLSYVPVFEVFLVSSFPGFIWNLAQRSAKDCTANSLPRMPRSLRIWEISLAKVILIFMNNQRPPKKILWQNVGKVIGIVGFGTVAFDIPKVTRMPRALRARFRTMVRRGANMKMLTGPQTSLASQIPRLMYVEAMKAFWQLGKGDTESGALSFGFCNSYSLNGWFFEYSHGIRHPY